MCKDITNKIEDDFSLLELLIHDCARAEKIYQPGIYWANKSKSAINEIRRHGLSDFRGATNGASTSYGDNAYIDIRSSYDHGIRALFVIILRKLYPFNILFNDNWIKPQSVYLIMLL